MIFLGLPEGDSSVLGNTDSNKVKNVLNKLDIQDTQEIEVKHLGQVRENQDKPRPILVTFSSSETPRIVIGKAKNLKLCPIPFNQFFANRATPPWV